MHKHFCLVCDRIIEEGNFDCENDSDHDFELCDECAAYGAEWSNINSHDYLMAWIDDPEGACRAINDLPVEARAGVVRNLSHMMREFDANGSGEDVTSELHRFLDCIARTAKKR